MSSQNADQFQTETAPHSTATANTRPNASAQTEANSEHEPPQSAAVESNGANADAEKTPGDVYSAGEAS